MEHRLLKRNFKVKIWKKNFLLGLIDKVQCEVLFDLRTWLKISDNP